MHKRRLQGSTAGPSAAKTVYDGLLSYDKEVKDAKLDLAKTFDNRFVTKALEKYRGK